MMGSITSIYKLAGPKAVLRAINEERVYAKPLLRKDGQAFPIVSSAMLNKVLRSNYHIVLVRIPESRAKIQEADNVSVGSFWLSMTPIPNATYIYYLKAKGIVPPINGELITEPLKWQYHGSNLGFTENEMAIYEKLSWKTNHPYDHPPDWFNYAPVVDTPYDQVLDFCQWAGLRLPNEIEWEKACRGTHGNIYAWGDNSTVPEGIAFLRFFRDAIVRDFPGSDHNYLLTGKEENGTDAYRCIHGPAPINRPYVRNGASAFGILDMSGNVWEWTSSIPGFSELEKLVQSHSVQQPSPFQALKDHFSDLGLTVIEAKPIDQSSDQQKNRVVRGGSWYFGKHDPNPPYESLQGATRRFIGIDQPHALRNAEYGIRLATDSL